MTLKRPAGEWYNHQMNTMGHHSSMPFYEIDFKASPNRAIKHSVSGPLATTNRNYNVRQYADYLRFQDKLKQKEKKRDKLKTQYNEMMMFQKGQNTLPGSNMNSYASTSRLLGVGNRRRTSDDYIPGQERWGVSNTSSFQFQQDSGNLEPLHGHSYDPFQADRLKKRKEKFEQYIYKGFSDDLQGQMKRLLKNKLGGLNDAVWNRQRVIDKDLDSLDLYIEALGNQNRDMEQDIRSLLKELKEHELYGKLEMESFLRKFLLFQRRKNKTEMFYNLWDKLHSDSQKLKDQKYIFPNDHCEIGMIWFFLTKDRSYVPNTSLNFKRNEFGKLDQKEIYDLFKFK